MHMTTLSKTMPYAFNVEKEYLGSQGHRVTPARHYLLAGAGTSHVTL